MTNTKPNEDDNLSAEALTAAFRMADAALVALKEAFEAYPDAELLPSFMTEAWDALNDARTAAEARLFNIHGIRL